MKTTIHGIDINLDDREYKTLGDIIDEIEANDGVVLRVIADGEDLSALSELELGEINPIEKLDIEAIKIEKLIVDSLSEAEEYIPKLMLGIDDIVNEFNRGNENQAFELLEQALEGFNWLNNAINAFVSNFSKYEIPNFDMKKLNNIIDAWQENLKELLTAIENQDIVLIADILEYELRPILNSYLSVIKEVNEEL
ncbi:hypothetical protein [Orenia marismortui]|uniref:hypothetical protein n=1 Tax=Orenia marismortui TaxID=46469 RepID=UPI00036B30EB|nr:hypothetical protein [Orenia marismortui]